MRFWHGNCYVVWQKCSIAANSLEVFSCKAHAEKKQKEAIFVSNSIALFSLIVLVACIAIGFVLKKNVGLIAVLAAAVFGSAAGYTDSQIIKGFSSSTFIMLLGVSLLCTIATNNGTLELAAKKFLRLSAAMWPSLRSSCT